MSIVTLRGTPAHTTGALPQPNQTAPDFTLTQSDLSDLTLSGLGSKRKLLNIFPSIDTGVCATSVRIFNSEAAALKDVAVINVSADLPSALSRFCGAEGIKNAVTVSSFRSTFAKDYGVEFADGPMRGLCSRAVVVLDGQNRVLYAEQVPEITTEPNYAAALKVLG